MQKCFFRNAVALFIAAFALLKNHTPFKIGDGNFKYLFLRSAFGTTGLFLNFYAVSRLDISDASILNKLSPFFAIIFSVFVLKEVANKYEWLAVCIAFIGAVFVVHPTGGVASIPAFGGMIGGMCAGFAYTFVRLLGKREENSMIIVFFFSAFSTICTLPFFIFNFVPMSLFQWTTMILAGVAAAGGQIFITKAYKYSPAKQISVYDYSIVLFAAIWGFLFLSQIPDYMSVIGYVLIIGTAVIKWYFHDRKIHS